MFAPHDPKQNHLLAAFSPDACDRVFPHLELLPVAVGQVLKTPGACMQHVYFPTTSIISLIYATEDGDTDEIAVVGNEGIVGVALFMGGETTPSRAVVQSPGYAYRLRSKVLSTEFDRDGEMLRLMLRYTMALMTQMSQAVACSRHHSVEQQFSRWLLLSLDRLASTELVVTQEFIAHLIGVRRESITEAARRLQAAGLIHYSRGHISVLDRRGLEKHACECYGVVKHEFDRLLPQHAAVRHAPALAWT